MLENLSVTLASTRSAVRSSLTCVVAIQLCGAPSSMPGDKMKTKFKNVIRLYCNQKLSLNNIIVLNKTDTHYLKNVMRCKKNDQINLFNENDQEFYSKILEIKKNETILEIFELSTNTETILSKRQLN